MQSHRAGTRHTSAASRDRSGDGRAPGRLLEKRRKATFFRGRKGAEESQAQGPNQFYRSTEAGFVPRGWNSDIVNQRNQPEYPQMEHRGVPIWQRNLRSFLYLCRSNDSNRLAVGQLAGNVSVPEEFGGPSLRSLNIYVPYSFLAGKLAARLSAVTTGNPHIYVGFITSGSWHLRVRSD